MFDRHKTLLFLLKLNIKFKELYSTANATPCSSKYKLPCPVERISFKYSYKVKVLCNIDATVMVSACPSSPV